MLLLFTVAVIRVTGSLLYVILEMALLIFWYSHINCCEHSMFALKP